MPSPRISPIASSPSTFAAMVHHAPIRNRVAGGVALQRARPGEALTSKVFGGEDAVSRLRTRPSAGSPAGRADRGPQRRPGEVPQRTAERALAVRDGHGD